MRFAEDAPAVIVSPHLDDAALGAYSVLAGPGEVLVVNVCDGEPDPGPPPFSVRLCNASDAVAQLHRRRAEDRAALAMVGRPSAGLGFQDGDGRVKTLTPGDVMAALDAAVPVASRVFAPIGLGLHPDHLLVRDAVLELTRQVEIPLTLQADVPYATRYGWPSWVTGVAPDPNLNPDADWNQTLDPLVSLLGRPRVCFLDDALLSAKQTCVGAYVSQLAMLNGGPNNRLAGWALRYEIFWPVEPGRS